MLKNGIPALKTDIRASETRSLAPENDIRTPETHCRTPENDIRTPKTHCRTPENDIPTPESLSPTVFIGVAGNWKSVKFYELNSTIAGFINFVEFFAVGSL